MLIAELERRSGLSRDTIRFYERAKLVSALRRRYWLMGGTCRLHQMETLRAMLEPVRRACSLASGRQQTIGSKPLVQAIFLGMAVRMPVTG